MNMKKLVRESLNIDDIIINEVINHLENYAYMLKSGETFDFNNPYDYENGEKILKLIKKIQ